MIEEIEKIIKQYDAVYGELQDAGVNGLANEIADYLQENYVIRSRQPERIARDVDEQARKKLPDTSASLKMARIKILHRDYGLGLGEAVQFVREYFHRDGEGTLKEPERNVL